MVNDSERKLYKKLEKKVDQRKFLEHSARTHEDHMELLQLSQNAKQFFENVCSENVIKSPQQNSSVIEASLHLYHLSLRPPLVAAASLQCQCQKSYPLALLCRRDLWGEYAKLCNSQQAVRVFKGQCAKLCF